MHTRACLQNVMHQLLFKQMDQHAVEIIIEGPSEPWDQVDEAYA